MECRADDLTTSGPIEGFHPTGYAALRACAADHVPVVMLNLLLFRPEGGRERYAEYADAVAPLLDRAGGRVVFLGDATPALLGRDSWDSVLLVEYATPQAFLEMIGSREYRSIAHLRAEALLKAELHPIYRSRRFG